MIEGLKAAPWFVEMSRRGQLAIDDCGRCMKTTEKLQRQALGCGYEPRTDRVHLQVWQPPGGEKGYQGEPLATCAGYTANLPEVLEASLLRVHWGKGNVDALALGEDMFNALIVLDGSYNQVQSWLMTAAKDGGGGR